ncbi:MAG: DnaK suppressor protein, putative, partial [uncultured Gemmatimonadaceae bacterium]
GSHPSAGHPVAQEVQADGEEAARLLREAAARGAQARPQGARPPRRDVRQHADRRLGRAHGLLVPHGRPGHRRDGAREGVPLRQPGGPLPLAHRRGAAPALPHARDLRPVPQLRAGHRLRAARRAPARALLHRVQAARRRWKAL